MPELDAETLDYRGTARLIKSAVSPRPIAWVSTVDGNGNDNLAPYSSYNYVAYEPPVVMFSASRKAGGEWKDSARNAVDTGAFAVNVVTTELAEVMDHTSKNLPRGESEFDFADVERADCTEIDAPRVADAAVSFECTLYDTKQINEKLLVFGEIQRYHVADRVLTDGEIDMRKLETVGRLGGPYYTASDRMELERQH